ncbi:type III-B CRISPR module RAMP protein Cmr4 [Ancylobacter sp. WKF20]|uniref:type III-B CRISPR module RAMP protein Cmr4 n=1 Tax=Ancylobacter sp. WKF20 TaxID=3039801 RepID=UPI002434433D|nr:type III-B CRISPR module RAMP protein Cmr4 [Ancylobacter sp. WKF20]WGD28400.1 type III-B CRISPR module RAMP protein Cmr4 [Ancylobacter sp. WKF20]
MTRSLWWLNAETSIHVGSASTASLIDQPVARESTTGYPFIPGSGLKGALRDAWRFSLVSKPAAVNLKEADSHQDIKEFFGVAEGAGSILISDGRLLLLPMRSLNHAFVWTTCPYLIKRYARDMEFCGLSLDNQFIPPLQPADHECFITHADDEKEKLKDNIWIEDHRLTCQRSDIPWNSLAPLRDESQETYSGPPVVVVSDRLFGHFARSRLPVRMRNQLNPDSKTVKTGHLWSEEALPPETVLYTILSDRLPSATNAAGASALSRFEVELEKIKHVQVGANETVGEGWLRVQPWRELSNGAQKAPQS